MGSRLASGGKEVEAALDVDNVAWTEGGLEQEENGAEKGVMQDKRMEVDGGNDGRRCRYGEKAADRRVKREV